MFCHPPGHYHSPLLDLRNLDPQDVHLPFDGEEMWENIDLRPKKQQAYYEDLFHKFPPLPFLIRSAPEHRYFFENQEWFVRSDAFTLSGIIQKEKPRRIIEAGSGFSSATVLDTLDKSAMSAALTCIEPHPERLQLLLRPADQGRITIMSCQVQEVPLPVFDQLEAQDILFIDTSHVAKIGSDVVFFLLRVLPRLKPGVLVHLHDIFYPFSYPIGWIRSGQAWNESLFLRAFLVENSDYEIVAFNSFAAYAFPETFRNSFPPFLENSGGSIWLRKVP